MPGILNNHPNQGTQPTDWRPQDVFQQSDGIGIALHNGGKENEPLPEKRTKSKRKWEPVKDGLSESNLLFHLERAKGKPNEKQADDLKGDEKFRDEHLGNAQHH